MEKNRNDSPDISFSVSVKGEITKGLSRKKDGLQAVAAGIDYCRDTDSVLLGDPLDPEFRRFFIRGAFLECGYISDPSKKYRVEFLVKNPAAASIIKEILEDEGIEFAVSSRNGLTSIYVSSGDCESDLLGILGAAHARLQFESIRTEHEVMGNVNRMINCDLGNTKRQVDASTEREELIRKLMSSPLYEGLPDNLKKTCELHMANPGASISQLGEMCDPPVGKSGMNNRLRKVLEIARTLD